MTRTVVLELGPCHRCGAETAHRVTVRRHNVTRYGDHVDEQRWYCERCALRLTHVSGDVVEDEHSWRAPA